jgi:hypothetical protein
MKKIILTLAGLIALTFSGLDASAQNNGSVALGLRMTPDGGGFSAKFFTTPNWVIETQLNAGGVFGGDGESFNAVALVEYHIYMPDPSWSIFFGGGLHGGVWDHDNRIYRTGDYYSNSRNSEGIFGLDAIGGVAYKFKKIPLSLSADMKPAVNLVENAGFFGHNMFGLAARVHF